MHTVSLQATLLPLGFCYSAARGNTFPFPASNFKKLQNGNKKKKSLKCEIIAPQMDSLEK